MPCLLLDLDLFKRTTDTHGQASGDQVLAAAAAILPDSRRRPPGTYRKSGL
jgi:GGDEF domain-containing protein